MAPPDSHYKISYRNVKYPRLEFRTGELVLILPNSENPQRILTKHKHWIKKQAEFIAECLRESQSKTLAQRTDEEFLRFVHRSAKSAAEKLGVSIRQIFIRKMKTKWASCSRKRNITINRSMQFLPDHLVDYVVFHEAAHILETKHNDKFWSIIGKEFHNYETLERELFAYWFLLQKSTQSNF